MFYIFLLLLAVLAVGAYALFVYAQIPELAEQRLGVLEPLPDDLGKWKKDENSAEAVAAKKEGLVREVRHLLLEGGLLSQGKLVRQVRYRGEGGEIVRVDPEQVIKRRRVKKAP